MYHEHDKKTKCEYMTVYMHNWNTFQICWEKISVSSFHWYVLKNNSYRLYVHSPPPPKKKFNFFSSTNIEFHTSLNRKRTVCAVLQWNNPFQCQLELPFQNFSCQYCLLTHCSVLTSHKWGLATRRVVRTQ